MVTINNYTVADATQHQYATTIPLQLQVNDGTTVQLRSLEQPHVPDTITFAEAEALEESSVFSA